MPPGSQGEIYIAGDGLARAYLGDPAATAQRFLPCPWDAGQRMYRTGDLGLLRNDGELLCLGRIDQQVKVRGFRIELGEIESAIALHPGIREACVALRTETGENELAAYLVAEEGVQAPPAGELLAYLRERLPDYMVPAALVYLPALPLTANGKVDTAALPAPDRSRPSLGSVYNAPKSELERTLALLWQEELKLDSVASTTTSSTSAALAAHDQGARAQGGLGARRAASTCSSTDHLQPRPTPGGRDDSQRPWRGRRAVPAPAARPDIAIVGMAGRFPGAEGVDELWANVTPAAKASASSRPRSWRRDRSEHGREPELHPGEGHPAGRPVDANFFG